MDPQPSGAHLRILRRIARRAMIERGFRPDFPAEVREEPASLNPESGVPALRDLRGLPSCSIDNDDSRGLDPLACARDGGGAVTVLVAIVDVADEKGWALPGAPTSSGAASTSRGK
ncbi:MAG: hypothetical protein KBH73_06790 [Syntrophobacterales bacterium]|nr:hypothetical protein [Syntrophobacterales bacterium]